MKTIRRGHGRSPAAILGLGLLLLFLAPLVPAVQAQDGTPEDYYIVTDYYGNLNYLTPPPSTQQSMGQIPSSGPYNFTYSYGGGALGDFDADGDYDYVVAGGYYGGDIFLYEKIDTGMSFAAPVVVGSWSRGYLVGDIEVGDFDQDGRLDFVLAHYGDTGATVYLNQGNLQFASAYSSGTTRAGSLGLAVADFNNDGILDMASAGYNYRPGLFMINLGNGDGSFTNLSTVTIPFSYSSSPVCWVVAGDFDEDGNADLLAPIQYGSTGKYYVMYLRGMGDGTFTWWGLHRYVYDSYYQPIGATDFDDDGHLDLLTISGYYTIFSRGNGNGDFSYHSSAGGGHGAERSGLAVPPIVHNTPTFRIASLEAQRGFLNVMGGASAGVLPGGEFFVRLTNDGFGDLDLSTLSCSPDFVSMGEVQEPSPGILELQVSIAVDASPGDYALGFSIEKSNGQVIETHGALPFTVLDPLTAATAVHDALSLQLEYADKPSFVARMDSQVISPLDQIQTHLNQLHRDGFTAQAQELLDSLLDCQAQAEAMIDGTRPSDAAQVQSSMNQAIGKYANQIIPGLEAMTSTSTPGEFNSLMQACKSAVTSLRDAADNAHEALAEALFALVVDTETLELFVHQYADFMLSETEAELLDTPALLAPPELPELPTE